MVTCLDVNIAFGVTSFYIENDINVFHTTNTVKCVCYTLTISGGTVNELSNSHIAHVFQICQLVPTDSQLVIVHLLVEVG